MSIKAVIFDMGGVIVRTEDPEPRRILAAELGMTPEELSHLVFSSETAKLATLGRLTTEEHWEAIRQALKMGPDQYRHVPSFFWGGDTMDSVLVDYLRSLRPHYKTGLLSNAWDDLRDVIIRKWKIDDAFDEIVISAEVGVAKPDPSIYHIAAEKLGVLPGEVVFVDDFIENVQGALQVGMQAIHFRDTYQTLEEIETLLGI